MQQGLRLRQRVGGGGLSCGHGAARENSKHFHRQHPKLPFLSSKLPFFTANLLFGPRLRSTWACARVGRGRELKEIKPQSWYKQNGKGGVLAIYFVPHAPLTWRWPASPSPCSSAFACEAPPAFHVSILHRCRHFHWIFFFAESHRDRRSARGIAQTERIVQQLSGPGL